MKVTLGAAIGLASLVVALGANAGSPAKAGFEPEWFTAVSANEFWLLGKAPCASGRCISLLHTLDGGRRFRHLSAPPVDGELRFADPRDGFVFGGHSSFYVTHNGGKSWGSLALDAVVAFATGGGNAYAVTARCTPDNCYGYRFRRSPVSSEAWTSTPMPLAPSDPFVSLSASKGNVWLVGSVAAPRHREADRLAMSADRGNTFVTTVGPCVPGRPAELAPTSSRVIWALCPGGLMSEATRSTDGGATFNGLSIPHCCVNSASLAPASAKVAVVAANGAGAGLLRTTDGGVTWRPARAPRNATYSVDFVDARVGFALVSIGPGPTQLWKTTDAGASWHRVSIR